MYVYYNDVIYIGGDSELATTTVDVLPTIMDDDESLTNINMDQFESPPVV